MNFDADISDAFFTDFAEPIDIAGTVHQILMDQDLEVVDEAGTVALIEYAVTARLHVLNRGLEFSYSGKTWVVGQALERSVDGKLTTWEVSGK